MFQEFIPQEYQSCYFSQISYNDWKISDLINNKFNNIFNELIKNKKDIIDDRFNNIMNNYIEFNYKNLESELEKKYSK